jgi:hypothetical protein
MNLIDQVTQHRKGIKHEAISFSLSEPVSMYRSEPKEVEINPDFQRLFRWSREQQSSFVESLILEIPIPPLFFYETQEGRWDLLDGLQRFSTIIRFMAGGEVPAAAQGIAANEDDWHYDNENNIDTTLQLLPGEYLTELQGLSFSTLPSQLQLNLKRARLQVSVLKRETDRMYKYEVFKRLNRGGSQLEDQEMRNCSVRLLSNRFPEFLRSAAENQKFRDAIALSEAGYRNGLVEELALRFFAMKNHATHFRHDVSEFITKFMEEVARNTTPFNYESETQLFNKTWDLIHAAAPEGDAFRARANNRPIGPFSPALFELVSIGIAANIPAVEQLAPAVLATKMAQTAAEARSRGLTGAGSNSRIKTLNRIDFGKHAFSH